ncbi:Teichoic acid translocation permease protein TagG [uncultured bacterium]|nr:Teichoic acid translocation permease protein TagG [uncultured bacterium]
MEHKSVVIEHRKGWVGVDFKELWKFRELLYFLAWRDIKVKYKQTALGVVWAVLQPVLAMLVFSLVFGRFASMPSEGVPYPVFVLTGLLLWNYFAAVLSQSTTSLVAGSNLVSKVYFPRLIIPASSAIAALIDFLIGFAVLLVMMLWYGVGLGPGVLLAPVIVGVVLLNAVGFGIWLSALNVRYRDVQYAVPFLIQIWMFASPVIYPASLLGEKWSWLLHLNPMSGVIEAIRPAMLGNKPIPWEGLAVSAAIGLAVFLAGVFYFRRVERYFADVI